MVVSSKESNATCPHRVAVVGVGYVGLTLLCALGRAGFSGVGYDVNAERATAIAHGDVPFDGAEPAMAALLRKLTATGTVTATTDPAALRAAEAIFIAVETPVDAEDHRPHYRALRAALETIGRQLAPGTLVVVESTIAPGTMQGLVLPTLTAATGGAVGRDFFLVHCPERVMPSRLLQNITTLDRVVGGMTPACTARALPIYARVTSGTLHPTDATTAEIVKTAENAYRDVQIAFANELALICEELGADVYAVRTLVNSSPDRAMHLPGAGVGGHCIPKDPWLLCAGVTTYQPRLLPTARAINDGMPLHLAALTQQALAAEGKAIEGAVVTLLGAAYLEETDDLRNTPTLPLARHLAALGATVRLYDPYVSALEEFPVCREETVLDGSDALILVTAHHAFRHMDLTHVATRMRTPILIDGRHAFDAATARAAGWRYSGIGNTGPVERRPVTMTE
jgi:UDP-N-acetyl-D-mannosaminuronic acid dehydrogenase